MNKKLLVLFICLLLILNVSYLFLTVTATEYPLSGYVVQHSETYTKMWAEGSCKLDNGTILCIYKRGTYAQNIGASLCMVQSTDDGETWGNERVLKAGDGNTGYLAKTLYLTPNGTLVIHYLEWKSRSYSYSCVMRSFDGGVNWKDDGKVSNTAEYYGHIGNSIILSDGYTIVVSQSESESTSYDNAECIISTDNASSWTRGNQVPRPSGVSGVYEPTVIELSNGTLMMLCRGENGYLWKTFSNDNGENWQEAFNSGITAPSAPADMLRYTWTPNCILMLWDNNNTNRYPLYVAASYDDGETWVQKTELQNSSLGNVAYPRFMSGKTTDDGNLLVTAWINTDSYADTTYYKFPITWLNSSFNNTDAIDITEIDNSTNSSALSTLSTQIEWELNSTAIHYEVEIATDSDFTEIVKEYTDVNEYNYPSEYNESATHAYFILPTPLTGYDTFYFRVRGYST